MDIYARTTRRSVSVDPTAAKYIDSALEMESIGDKLLNLVLNGPTLNAFNKDNLRALLRQIYTRLRYFEDIGPLASPIINDPLAIVSIAFSQLYPGIEYRAQFAGEVIDVNGEKAYGETCFPDDGSTPFITISAVTPIGAGPEIFAHELAHIAAGREAEHGAEWEAAMDKIHARYEEIAAALFPGEPEEAPSVGDCLCLPLKENIPEPSNEDWKLTTCPVCGAECWKSDLARQAMAAMPNLRPMCTACALKHGNAGKGDA